MRSPAPRRRRAGAHIRGRRRAAARAHVRGPAPLHTAAAPSPHARSHARPRRDGDVAVGLLLGGHDKAVGVRHCARTGARGQDVVCVGGAGGARLHPHRLRARLRARERVGSSSRLAPLCATPCTRAHRRLGRRPWPPLRATAGRPRRQRKSSPRRGARRPAGASGRPCAREACLRMRLGAAGRCAARL